MSKFVGLLTNGIMLGMIWMIQPKALIASPGIKRQATTIQGDLFNTTAMFSHRRKAMSSVRAISLLCVAGFLLTLFVAALILRIKLNFKRKRLKKEKEKKNLSRRNSSTYAFNSRGDSTTNSPLQSERTSQNPSTERTPFLRGHTIDIQIGSASDSSDKENSGNGYSRRKKKLTKTYSDDTNKKMTIRQDSLTVPTVRKTSSFCSSHKSINTLPSIPSSLNSSVMALNKQCYGQRRRSNYFVHKDSLPDLVYSPQASFRRTHFQRQKAQGGVGAVGRESSHEYETPPLTPNASKRPSRNNSIESASTTPSSHLVPTSKRCLQKSPKQTSNESTSSGGLGENSNVRHAVTFSNCKQPTRLQVASKMYSSGPIAAATISPSKHSKATQSAKLPHRNWEMDGKHRRRLPQRTCSLTYCLCKYCIRYLYVRFPAYNIKTYEILTEKPYALYGDIVNSRKDFLGEKFSPLNLDEVIGGISLRIYPHKDKQINLIDKNYFRRIISVQSTCL